ncbi:GmrSD restriction endonuclease domain-containing protein [Asanoa siamensis]|uniref:GmrSD restriction endonucleases N-terminal domain-containing protein n=1 Tax=Asanoa siamensis TaxID=926357 RepID=A0ABQ4CI63_9ACTN|nr:DUF262 domain-containing protein [Asanoa siamensis]GIF70969.1 hypothetical protein Asi02nite_04870 [Asanoa siamensis]
MSELTSYPIRKILDQVYAGQIRIPAFQRGFVWDAAHVAHFLDSIYKGYPFGSLLLWLTQERLTSERDLGPFELPNPHEKYPTSYVLDGQQRVTSLFVSFQTEFEAPKDPSWRSVYFDLSAPDTAQQSQFVALKPSEVDPDAHFPLSSLFDSVAYRKASSRFIGEREIRAVDKLHSVFKEAQIPIQTMETEDRATVAIVFERINRMGVALTTLELLSAWTWSEQFDLRNELETLQEELEDFAFGDIGADPNLVLRCCAAILKSDPSIDVLMKLDGDDVRDNFDRVQNGIKGAVEFLQKQLHVATLRTLPYPLLLVPLSVYFAVPGNSLRVTPEHEVRTLKRWFWRSCFAERYSGQTVRAARADIHEMALLRDGIPNVLGDFTANVSPIFFLYNDFRPATAKTATFVNLLAQLGPRSFISGNRVDLEKVLQAYNRAEFHHMYPKAYVQKNAEQWRSNFVNSLANFCFLSRADNNKIRAQSPQDYRKLMPSSESSVRTILATAAAGEWLFTAGFDDFVGTRAVTLTKIAKTLIEKGYVDVGDVTSAISATIAKREAWDPRYAVRQRLRRNTEQQTLIDAPGDQPRLL